MTRRFALGRWFLMIGVALFTIALMIQSSQVAAVSYPLRPTFPPLPTATPTPPPTTRTPPPPGAYIELHLRPPDPALWTVVEWQDGLGQWHRVDGWQGPIDGVRDGVGTKRWWLSATLFGRGLFRWVALSRVEGEPLAVSAPFTLPAGIDVTAVVTLTVP